MCLFFITSPLAFARNHDRRQIQVLESRFSAECGRVICCESIEIKMAHFVDWYFFHDFCSHFYVELCGGRRESESGECCHLLTLVPEVNEGRWKNLKKKKHKCKIMAT